MAKLLTKFPIYQQGTILIVALFIITLVEIVVVGVVIHHRIAIHHSRNYFDGLEAINIALGGEEWAKQRISLSFKNNENMIFDVLPREKIAGGYVEGVINDEQGKFNLNNITPENITNFSHMLKSILPTQNDLDTSFIPTLIKSKFSSFINTQSSSADMVPIASVTELRALKGMNSINYGKIVSHISALPEVTALNVNSATKYSLMTLSDKLTEDTANSIIKIRDSMNGFSSIETFMALGPLKDIEMNTSLITIQSQYFISSITVQYQNINLTLNSLLKVVKDNNRIRIQVVWRSFGTL